MRISLENEPLTLDWQRYQIPQDRNTLSYMMRGLMTYVVKPGELSNLPVCDLCESYESSQDHRTFTFKMKTDLRWSDGKPLVAQHFVDGFQRLKNIQSSSGSSTIAIAYPPFEAFAKDSQTLEVKLDKPHALFIHYLTLPPSYPIRKEFLPTEKDPDRHVQNAVIGSYMLAEWNRGKNLTLEKNPFDQAPAYRVRFEIGEHASLFRLFKNGKLDIFSEPTTDDLVAFSGKREDVQVSKRWATRFLAFNAERPHTSLLPIRKAVQWILDRSEIPALVRNGERLADHLIPPGLLGHSSKYKPNRAEKDLAEAERNRGVRWPKWIDLEILLEDTPVNRKIYAWIEDSLKGIHVHTRGILVNAKDFHRRFFSKDYDLAIHQFSFQIADAIELLSLFQSSNRYNFTGFKRGSYDLLFENYQRETHGDGKAPKEHTRLVDSMTQMLIEDEVIVLPLGFPSSAFLLGSRVDAFSLTPFGDPDLLKIRLK